MSALAPADNQAPCPRPPRHRDECSHCSASGVGGRQLRRARVGWYNGVRRPGLPGLRGAAEAGGAASILAEALPLRGAGPRVGWPAERGGREPDADGLVVGRRREHVRVGGVPGHRVDGARVALQRRQRVAALAVPDVHAAVLPRRRAPVARGPPTGSVRWGRWTGRRWACKLKLRGATLPTPGSQPRNPAIRSTLQAARPRRPSCAAAEGPQGMTQASPAPAHRKPRAGDCQARLGARRDEGRVGAAEAGADDVAPLLAGVHRVLHGRRARHLRQVICAGAALGIQKRSAGATLWRRPTPCVLRNCSHTRRQRPKKKCICAMTRQSPTQK